MVTTEKSCKATTKSGTPCRCPVVADSDFCYIHAPDRAAQRAESRRRGGKARHGRVLFPVDQDGPVNIQTVGDVLALVERAVNDVLLIENSLNRGRVLGGLAAVALKALEVGSLADRLAALEERAKRLEEKSS